jgi:hypothetical protein
MFGNDDKRDEKPVNNHRPVFAEFRTDLPADARRGPKMARIACLVALISAAAAFAQGGEKTKEVQSPEPVLEESKYQVFQKVAEANRRLKSAFDDQSLTSAQKDSEVQKEFDALKDLLSGKRWVMVGKITDVARREPSGSWIDVARPKPSGLWEVTVGLPETAESFRGNIRPALSIRVDT